MGYLNVQTLLEDLSRQDLIVGFFLAGAGLVFMCLGTRMFRSLIGVSYGVVGFVLGGSLPLDWPLRVGAGLIAAIGLAIACTFFMRCAVGLLAGCWSGVILMAAANALQLGDQPAMLAGCLGFAGAIALTFIMYDEVLAAVTSLQGALLCIGGLATFASQSPSLWVLLKSMLLGSPIFGPFMVVAGTVTGVCLQLSDLRHKDSGVTL
jgi:hypothetical protein